MKFRTDEEKRAILTAIDRDSKEMSQLAAAKKHGVAQSLLGRWREKLADKTGKKQKARPKSKPYVANIETGPVQNTSKVICIIGDAQSIRETIRQWQQ